jgi:drug/metabolite transporter (DMT)-like permease
MAVLAALGAAVLYALASVLQQRAAAEQPVERALRVGLLMGLVRRRMWLAGIGADIAAFVLQFVALAHGSLVLVQPLLVSGLLFAVPLSVALDRRRPRAVDWTGSALVVAGLTLFLVVAQPGRGRADISGNAWALLLLLTVMPAVLAALGGRAARGALSAGLLATSGGVIYGASAALTKAVGHLLDGGVVHALSAWQPYALVVLGLGGMIIVQSAFQAGPLAWSLPTLTVVDPVVSILIGAVAFGEHVATGPFSSILEVVGLTAVMAGVFALALSPSRPGPAGEQGDDADLVGSRRRVDRGGTTAPPRRGQPEAMVEAVDEVDAVASPRSASTGPMRSSKLSR